MYKVLYVLGIWTSVVILPTQVENSIVFKNHGSILRKSQQKCNQYVLQACKGTLDINRDTDSSNAVSAASSVAGDFSANDSVEANEFMTEENFSEVENVMNSSIAGGPIVGGKISVPKEYPHMALIGSGRRSEIRWFCGGSLISEQYVLGAAHCVPNDGGSVTHWVRLGELDLETLTDEANTKDIEIIGIIVHPEYKYPNLYNDIALFRLKTSVTFNDYIRPICLNTHQRSNITRATVAGWGSTGYGEKRSPWLLSVELDIQNSENCDKIYRGEKMKNGFNDSTMICAGYAPGGKDSCQGDSGGPLMVHFNAGCPNLYLQIGIVSFGEGCAFQDTPAIYTKVSYFISWIENIVWR